ncbi:hypothetical protein EAH76_09990 [Sphingomonas glacialis]|uniref:DUF4349 domain-containing protein n=1 Tax=Sphingomonas glacialis TaxID=658225 RepID=A0A502G0W5_9SPHN|nr:hypothetical protein EAH76_09990 [Sphingomonas glacialis]
MAFAYRYAFRMPAAKIAQAQEAHAQACEKLGPARCRITGMRYRLLGENNVEAMLAFKLDPGLARGFGRDAIASVTAESGKLVDAEISGTDAGAAIKQLETDAARLDEQRKRNAALLDNPKLKADQRSELSTRQAELDQTAAATRDSKAAQQESLAVTLMVFDYGAGPAVRGFDPSAPLTSAANTAIGSAQFTLALLLGGLALFGPPGLVAIVVVLLWRRWRPRKIATASD